MVSTGGFKQTALMLMPCARLRRPCPLQDAQPARQRRARYSNRCNVPLTERKKKKKKSTDGSLLARYTDYTSFSVTLSFSQLREMRRSWIEGNESALICHGLSSDTRRAEK